MASSRRSCLNHPHIFCYICGSYASKEQRKLISAFVKRAYSLTLASELEIKTNNGLPTLLVKPV